MPTNAEVQAWLAQRQVPQTAQNANIAARIMGADAIASRGGAQTGALDASEEINRLYDQLNQRSMGGGRSRGAAQPGTPGQGRGDPTPAQNPANSTGGAPDRPPDVGGATPAGGPTPLDPDTNLEGDPATLAALLGFGGAAALARRLRGMPTAPGSPPIVPGGAPSGGGPTPRALPPPNGLTYRGSSPNPGGSGGAPVLPTPDPQLLLPAPARALPPPAARGGQPIPVPPMPPAGGGGIQVPAGDIPTAPAPRMTPPNVPQQSSLGPQQSIMRVPQASPVQRAIIDAQLSRAAGPRVGGRPTPSPATAAARSPTGVRVPAGAVRPGVRPGFSPGQLPVGVGAIGAPIPWPTAGWHAPM